MEPTTWLSEYGYLGVALVVFFEMIGIPFPAETTLILAGMGWASGTLHPVPLIITAIVAHLAGSMIAYGLGRSVGRAVLVRYGRFVGLTVSKLETAEAKFHRYEKSIIAFGKFLAVVRILIPYIAGINRVNFWRFTIINAISCIVWVITFTVAGRYLGKLILAYEDQLLAAIKPFFTTYGWPLGIGIVVIFIIWGYVRKQKQKANA